MSPEENNRHVLSLWDFSDPAGSRARFEVSAAVARTQVARALGLAKDYEQALRVLDAIDEIEGEPRVRVLLERGRVLNSSGDPVAAAPLFRQAFDLAVAGDFAGLAADAAHMVAIAVPEESAEWTDRGLAVAADSTDPLAQAMVGALLNNHGWNLADADRWDEAYELFDRAVGVRQQVFDSIGGHAAANALHIARWTRARAARALGRHAQALAEQEELAATEIGAADEYVAEELALLRSNEE